MNRRYLQKIFGQERRSFGSASHLQGSDTIGPLYETDMGVVYMAQFFPSVEGIRMIRNSPIDFPKECCVCGQYAEHALPIRPASFVRLIREKIGAVDSVDVPHCSKHAKQRYALFAGGFYSTDMPNALCYSLGLNKLFLEKLRDKYTQGEYMPPWEFFPRQSPEGNWHMSSDIESWVFTVWRPFWKKFPQGEKQDYLERWNATDDWIEALSNENWPWTV